VAAISVGVVGGVPLLDLDAPEDQGAEVDLNVVGTATGELVEVQGTGESRSFHRKELDNLLDLALAGIAELIRRQDSALAGVLDAVEEVRSKGTRRPAAPKDERELWGKPD
jgi:ribonuclease PH